MTIVFTRNRIRAAVVALCGIAAISTAAATLGPAAAAGRAQQRPGVSAASVPVVIDCAGHGQVKPGRYILACGDANAYITGMHWAAWQTASAFGEGTYTFKVCVPTCPAGHLQNFPMLAALWRAMSRPGHPGESYFTRLTVILTGRRSYRVGGKTFRLPQTLTFPLSALGGAGT